MPKCRKKIQKLRILAFSAVLLAGITGVEHHVKGGLLGMDETQQSVKINEVCSSNFSVHSSQDGRYYGYIELYNPTKTDISLDGYYLSGKAEKKFTFENQMIPAEGYLLVYASDEEIGSGEIHVPFRLSKKGERILLAAPDGRIADWVDIPTDLKYNTSYGRETDGDGEWLRIEASPEKSNDTAKRVAAEVLKEPGFSAECGFYEMPFELEIKVPKGTNVYYTLDGSEPDPETAERYEEPILVTDVSGKENIHSVRTDLSAGFFEEDDRYAVPEEKIDKAFIIRAAAYDDSGWKKSKTITKTYFVGFDQKEYEDFEVISLVTDPANLFDYETGIYVAGKTFDDFVESGKREEMRNPDMWRKWQANYMNRGKEWERPVHVDYFNPDRDLVFSQELGLRIKGGTTRSYTQKSFNLFARNIYGQNEFEVPFFGEKAKRRVTLYTVANDYRSKLRDPLLMDLCSERAFATMETRPCYVFLDGEYWGMYYLMEKYGDDYLEENFGVKSGDAVIAKNNQIEGENPADGVYLEELKKYISEHDLQTKEEYQELDTIIDMKSYLDYYAAQIYIARSGDWPVANEACWRTKEKKDKTWYDGRWRWMIYDVNWSCLSDSIADENTIAYVRSESGLFDKLSRNKYFRQDFTNTVCDLMNSVFKAERVAPNLTERIEKTRDSVIRDLRKYYGDHITQQDYEEDVDDLCRFFINRPQYMIWQLTEEFELTGTLEKVTVSAGEGGSVLLNTLTIKEGEEFTGEYFTDYPVTLTAEPQKGYRFAGWQESGADAAFLENGGVSVEVMPKSGGIRLLAVFEKE